MKNSLLYNYYVSNTLKFHNFAYGTQKMPMRRFYFCCLLLFVGFSELYAQPGNYWSMGSNTEASLLAGAVVGGGSGITSIYYNPAGISELTSNKISLDASLFNFRLYTYDNAFGSDRELDYLNYEIQPRFFSFLFHPKNSPRFSFQFAVFSRGLSLVKLYDFSSQEVTEPVTNLKKEYAANFDYESRYSDYWTGLGVSYKLNDNWVFGASLLGSVKSFIYYDNSSINLSPLEEGASPISKWYYYDRQDLFVVSLITKLGVQYYKGRWSYGLNVNLPSLRLWGDGYHNREVSLVNIYEDGELMEDVQNKEANNYLIANFKEPLSVAMGLTYSSTNERTRIFLSAEYFAPIETYNVIDNSKIAIYKDDEYFPGTDFLTFKYGAKEVTNVGVGVKQKMSERLAVLMGFKTDFSSYYVDDYDRTKEGGQYHKGQANLYHIPMGVQFKVKRTFILLGLEYTFGSQEDIVQFTNFNYPGVYDPERYIALQDYPRKEMVYKYNGLGVYLGISLDF